MKQIVVGLLVLLTLTSTIMELSIIVSFKVHQQEIAYTVCTSSNLPINTCQGSCYLEKQLDKVHNHDHNPSEDVLNSPKQKDSNLFREVHQKSQHAGRVSTVAYKFHISGSPCTGYPNYLLDPPEIS